MKSQQKMVLVSACLLLAWAAPSASAPPAGQPAAEAPAGVYEIDPSHASIAAKVGHLGFSTTTVRFPKIAGNLVVDTSAAAKTALNIEIQTDSLTSDWEARDKDLRGPGFFNTAAFPTAKFVSNELTLVDARHARVKGQLTLLGVTRPVDLEVTLVGTGKGMMGDQRLGFAGHAHIKRSEFGMKTFIPAVSDDVEIDIDAEFSRK